MSSNWVKFAEKSGVKFNPVTNTCICCDEDKYWSGLCYNHFMMWYTINMYSNYDKGKTVFGDSQSLLIRDYIRLLKKYEPEKYAKILTKMNMINIIK